MTPDEMKNLVRTCMLDGFSKNDLSVLEGKFKDDYRRHTGTGAKEVSSFAEHIEDLKGRHTALSNAHFELDEIIAEGNTVAARFTMVGTHTGEFFGYAPTGKVIRRKQLSMFRIEDGKIAESWNLHDMLGMFEQLKQNAAEAEAA